MFVKFLTFVLDHNRGTISLQDVFIYKVWINDTSSCLDGWRSSYYYVLSLFILKYQAEQPHYTVYNRYWSKH